jgi:hypothetical protein
MSLQENILVSTHPTTIVSRKKTPPANAAASNPYRRGVPRSGK